jgi:hypothetical protein
MLTGVPLFSGSMYELMAHHCQTPPRKPSDVRPDLDTRIDDLCSKALAKQPSDRYTSARGFADAIAACLRAVAASVAPSVAVPVVAQAQVSIPSPPVPDGREQKWQVTVPGSWFSRLVGGWVRSWKKVVETPAEITTRPGEEYGLHGYGASDADLEGLAHLKELTALQELSLNYFAFPNEPHITDAGLAHLGGLTALRTLELRICPNITDAGLANLGGLTALQDLTLQSCDKVTDAGVARLKALASLQSLYLIDCNKITDVGVAELKKALPMCNIFHGRPRG